ncbi:angiopoietin-2-like [Armigeres subalbatus]|uniref:angiopoietin-2-like n=1 Tax=Armigeres subalbatus TaxID=124917 RepID=UPI002ED68DCE
MVKSIMVRSSVFLLIGLVVFCGQSNGLPYDQDGTTDPVYGDSTEASIQKPIDCVKDNENENKEVLLKLDRLESKFMQLEDMMRKIIEAADANSEKTSLESLSSKILMLENKLLHQGNEMKKVTETRAMRSIDSDDTEQGTLLSKIDVLENRLSQQNDDMKKTMEVSLQQLEENVKKVIEVTVPGPITNKTINLANRSPADSFGLEMLRLKIDFQEVKLLQLATEIKENNEKISKSLDKLEKMYGGVSDAVALLEVNVVHGLFYKLNQTWELLQQHELYYNGSFHQVLTDLNTITKINSENYNKNEQIILKLDSIETLNLKVPELFIDFKQLIGQNLSQMISQSTSLSQQNISCIKHSDLKQTLYDLIILKNSAKYFQVATLHQSCKESKLNKKSGKYLLHPVAQQDPFEGYCEQDKFNGGWLVIQHRFNGSVDFYRNWSDYKNGFGTVGGEFWLGLETVHRLTKEKNFTLMIEMEDFSGKYAYAKYDRFEVGSEDEWYSLKRLGAYSGTAGDGLVYSAGANFTTWDSDHDQSSENCAVQRYGAWWYKSCTFSNLNGKYQKMPHHQSLCWYYYNNSDEGLKVSRMMIREV